MVDLKVKEVELRKKNGVKIGIYFSTSNTILNILAHINTTLMSINKPNFIFNL